MARAWKRCFHVRFISSATFQVSAVGLCFYSWMSIGMDSSLPERNHEWSLTAPFLQGVSLFFFAHEVLLLRVLLFIEAYHQNNCRCQKAFWERCNLRSPLINKIPFPFGVVGSHVQIVEIRENLLKFSEVLFIFGRMWSYFTKLDLHELSFGRDGHIGVRWSDLIQKENM